MSLPWPEHYYPDDVAKHATQNGIVAVHIDDLKRWQMKMQDAFDLGFKAAGGTMIPDGARDHVELSLDRDQIDVLANAAEICLLKTGVEEVALSFDRPGEQDAMKKFLETVSIYRRKS